MSDVLDYPDYPAWSRGWDANVGPTWECPTDEFPVITVKEPRRLTRILTPLLVLAMLVFVGIMVFIRLDHHDVAPVLHFGVPNHTEQSWRPGS